ncbi:uncharacterized protein LOC119557059 isoform X2 [Drosophila subpulchrella]|uniref:uncharacterized protein LOC119557059 isoform X2 n=1 Tax=Drosophila subpulchrella TaxID=1486046 RepID=UPI0018A1916B|nr:uncharacterized protein LOC119557059 isoform X2 [Drosophila subpulchrella]
MKYISKRQRKRQKGVQFSNGPSTASSSDENSSESVKPNKAPKKGKSKNSLKNSAVAGTKNQENSPATGNRNRRPQNLPGPKKSNSQSSINSLSSGSTMTRYSNSSGRSNSSGELKVGCPRASIYHFQNAHSITLANFLLPKVVKHAPPRKGHSRTARCSSSACRIVSPPISPPTHIDLGEDPDMPDTPWISNQKPVSRTSVLCGQMDLGPLMQADGQEDLLDDDGFPPPSFWCNPYGLSYIDTADSAESHEDIFVKHEMKPIGYEMLMRAKQRAHLEKMYDEEVAKLVALVEATKLLWESNQSGISLGKTIWSVDRFELIQSPFNRRNVIPPKQQDPIGTHSYANGNPIMVPSTVVYVPGLWIQGQPMQVGYWHPYWPPYWPTYWPQPASGPINNENWWDNANYIDAIAKMEMFLANLSPTEIYAAQMYALHGEAFFDTPMGRCYKASLPTPPAFGHYYQVPQPFIYPSAIPQPYFYPSAIPQPFFYPYVYQSAYHQPSAYTSAAHQLAGRATNAHPKQPMPKSRPGEEGSRPGGSRPGGSGQAEAEGARKASPGAMGANGNKPSNCENACFIFSGSGEKGC